MASEASNAPAAAEAPPADEAAQQAAAAESAPPAEQTAAEAAAQLPPIIIKKVMADGHAGGHGGAWKIALADMMTAMMAFFLLMWILGATDADQRKSIADYFKPTSVVTMADKSGGSTGFFGGMSVIDPKALPQQMTQSGLMQLQAPGREEEESTQPDEAMPEGLSEEERKKIAAEQDEKQFEALQKKLEQQIQSDEKTADLMTVVSFVKEKEGLRIEILDDAGFSMFTSGTNAMDPQARALMQKVGESLKGIANEVAVRGHTDSHQFKGSGNNNWSLSANRADATRQLLNTMGVDDSRFARIEGVADSQPVNAADPYDPKNRRISITVLYRDPNQIPTRQE